MSNKTEDPPIQDKIRKYLREISNQRVIVYSVVCISISMVLIFGTLLLVQGILKDTLLAVGTTLLSIGGISILSEAIFRKYTEDMFEQTFEKNMVGLHKDMERLISANQEFLSQGFKGIGDRENLDWHKYLLESAKRKVKLLGCTLQHWQTRSEDLIIKRVEDGNDQLVIQILLLNPWSDVCFKRGRSPVMNSQGEGFKRDVINHIQWYLQLGEKIRRKNFELIPRKFDVRLYNSLPYCSLMLRDDVINLGVYLENARGTKTMYLEIASTNKENDYFSKLEEHFDICWNNAISIFSKNSETNLTEAIKEEVNVTKDEMNNIRKEIHLLIPKSIYLNSSFRSSLKDGYIATELRKKLEEEGCFLGKEAQLVRKSPNTWTVEVGGQFHFKSMVDNRNGIVEDTGDQINICFP